jgi:hypothetical protein
MSKTRALIFTTTLLTFFLNHSQIIKFYTFLFLQNVSFCFLSCCLKLKTAQHFSLVVVFFAKIGFCFLFLTLLEQKIEILYVKYHISLGHSVLLSLFSGCCCCYVGGGYTQLILLVIRSAHLFCCLVGNVPSGWWFKLKLF